MHPHLREHFEQALKAGDVAAREGRFSEAWPLLERAHVLGQPYAGPHVRSHWAMLACGVRQRDARQIAGQIVRLLVAAPASLAGVAPLGNTGGADVPMGRPMPIAEELRRIIAGEAPPGSTEAPPRAASKPS